MLNTDREVEQVIQSTFRVAKVTLDTLARAIELFGIGVQGAADQYKYNSTHGELSNKKFDINVEKLITSGKATYDDVKMFEELTREELAIVKKTLNRYGVSFTEHKFKENGDTFYDLKFVTSVNVLNAGQIDNLSKNLGTIAKSMRETPELFHKDSLKTRIAKALLRKTSEQGHKDQVREKQRDKAQER